METAAKDVQDVEQQQEALEPILEGVLSTVSNSGQLKSPHPAL